MTNTGKIILLFFVLGVFTLLTTSCGRYSAPSPVEDSGYPHSYPRG